MVTGVDDEGTPANGSGSERVPVTDVLPTMTVTKTADPNPIPEPGGPVTYTVRVENTSPESIFIRAIFDDVAGSLTPGTCVLPAGGELSAGDTYECSWSGSVSGDVGDVRSNIVTVTASDDEGNVIEVADREDTVISDVLPTFDLLKTATPTSLPEPGGNVTFTVWLTNTTIEPITVDAAVDDVYGPLSGLGTCDTLVGITIVPGDTYLCTFVAPVTGTAALSPYTDTITVAVSDNDGNSVEGDASADVELTNVTPTIRLRKGRNPASLPEPGGVFTFTIRVDNQSAFEDLILTSLDDDIYGDIADPSNPDIVSTTCVLPQTITPGGRYDCRFEGEFFGDAGASQRDVVTATAEDDEGTQVTDTDPATVRITDVLPQISATKTPAPASLPEPGGDVTFSVEIFNDSTVESVELTTLGDDIYGDLTSTAGDIVSTTCVLPQTIAIGGSYACEFVAPVTGTAEASPYTDTITATATDNEGNSAQAEASADVTLTDVLPAITVDKTASPLTLPEPGGTFTFGVTVTNDSVEPVTLTSLTDDIYGDLDGQGDCSLPQTIAVGGSYSCAFDGDFNGNAFETQTDVVTASADDDEGNTATDDDDATVTLTDVLPAITVDKTASPLTLPEPGGTFTFGVTVTNDSVEPVTLTSLTDDIYGDLDGQGDCSLPQTIAVGGSYSCAFDGDFNGNAFETQTDVVTASADDDEGNTATDDDDATVTLTDVLPAITVDKTASPLTLPEPGGTFTFGVTVTNDSVEPVTLTSLTDDIYGDLDGQGDCSLPQTIAVGGSYSCAFDGDFNGNAFETQTDVVTASADDDEGNTATDDDDATVDLTDVPSSIEVTKDASPTEVNEPGDTVTFSITVENTSPVDTVTIDSLTDDIHGDLDGQGDCAVPFDLAPAGTYGCSFSADVTGNAGDTETDTVTAAGVDDDDAPVSDDDDATVTILDVLPAITVDKTASPLTLPEPGGTFTFGVTVTNDSVEPVTLTSLTDDIYGDLDGQGDCSLPQTIAVGGSYSCAFDGDFNGNAFETQTDVVTASADDDEGNTATDDDDATVELTDVPSSIEVTKDASPTEVNEPGADVVFSVSIENTSEPDVVTIESITDDIYGDATQIQGDISATDCAVPFDLAPGGAYDCTFTAFVRGNAGDIVTDTVTAAGIDDDGSGVSDSDTADVEILDVLPQISLVKTAEPVVLDEPGGEFTFSIVVTNESVEPVELTSLTDDVYGDITQVQGQITSTTCVVPTAIDVNGSYECSFTGLFEGNAGDTQTDIVSGVAQDDEANQADASDDAFVELLPVPPVISATKTPNPTEVVAPGGDVTFTITITNESTFEPVTIDGLEDSVYGDLNGRGSCLADGSITLQPGQTYTCRFTAEVTGSAGSTHRNTIIATASDDDPEPAVVTAGAPAEVAILAAPLLVQPETNMLIATDTSDPLESGLPLAELVRAFVLLLAASILVGGLGIAVVRRARA